MTDDNLKPQGGDNGQEGCKETEAEKEGLKKLIEEPPILPIKTEAQRLVGMFYDALVSHPKLLGEVAKSSRLVGIKKKAKKKKKFFGRDHEPMRTKRRKSDGKYPIYTYLTPENMKWLEHTATDKGQSLTRVVNCCLDYLRESKWDGVPTNDLERLRTKKKLQELQYTMDIFDNASNPE